MVSFFNQKNIFNVLLSIWVISIPFKNALYQGSTIFLIIFFLFLGRNLPKRFFDKEEIGQIINEEKAKMQKEKALTLKEIKGEVVDLVFASMEKILDKKIDSDEEKKMIKKMIS